ncbi:MAG: hypothetical protein Q8Q33_10165 [Chlamydiota bacterium]|nr:hypothetical protein [Chlamydiota bacterium]
MGVRKTVFGSSLEKRCFRKLSETWGKDYHVYHNLPFLNVFTGRTELFDDECQPFTLSDEEYDLLKKTSIDFTVCDKKDTPLVCVEFDGLQDGFNVGTNYHLRNGSPGRKARRAVIELKLRAAHGSLFPYLVLGSEEFRGLSEAVRLTIADGLIGEVISLRATRERIDAGFDPTQCGYSTEEFDALSSAQQSEIIGDWVTMIELESDFKHNPIVREVARLSSELHATGYGMTFLNNGQHDRDKWVWMQSDVTSSRYGTATANVCLPDFKTPFCYFTVHVAQEIGHLLALEQLRKRWKEHKKKNKRANKTAGGDA